MTSIKLKFIASKVEGTKGMIYYQVIHQRIAKSIKSELSVYPEEWDQSNGKIAENVKDERKEEIEEIRRKLAINVNCLHFVVEGFESGSVAYSSEEVIEKFVNLKDHYSFFEYMKEVTGRTFRNGKSGTWHNYKSTLNKFTKFREGKDLCICEITKDLMIEFEAWMQGQGLVANTTSFYMRVMRATYNKAVDEGFVKDTRPFRKVYTGIGKTKKRALQADSVSKIKNLDLTDMPPKLAYARDMFLLSFYLRGMSLIDMAGLRQTDLWHGYVVYRRHKTGQRLQVKWTQEMQTIVDRWHLTDNGYLLPFLDRVKNDMARYQTIGCYINMSLKKVAELAGIPVNLSLYVARHSWASVAYSRGIPVGVISEGMGHDSERTTRIYLASLDNCTIDDANQEIIDSI